MRAISDWLTARDADPALRDELLATLIQRRPAVFISAAAILMMSSAAAWLIAAPWTFAWLAADLVLVATRLYLSFRYDRGGRGPSERRGTVVALMFFVFMIFGAGCAMSIAIGSTELMVMAIISMMGVFVGLVSRWSALPRLALLTIFLLSAMVGTGLALRVGGGLGLAAVQFLLIAGTAGAQAVQNHRILLRMLSAERRNWKMARRDALTRLGNRVRLIESLGAACARLNADPFDRDRHFAILYLDLDGFKAINDKLGHEAGDRLLEAIGRALAAAVGGADSAFRVGGDEFVILGDGAGTADATLLARRVIAAVSGVAGAGGRRVTASIGITLACTDNCDPRGLLAEADAALYFAKGRGKARYHLYGDEEVKLLQAS